MYTNNVLFLLTHTEQAYISASIFKVQNGMSFFVQYACK